MTERDLEHLKDLPVPAPRAEARRAALDAALQAFDAGAGKENGGARQGNVSAAGQTETSKAKRSFRMLPFSRTNLALAASIAALIVAAPFAFRHLEDLQSKAPETGVVATLDFKAPSSASVAADKDGRPAGKKAADEEADLKVATARRDQAKTALKADTERVLGELRKRTAKVEQSAEIASANNAPAGVPVPSSIGLAAAQPPERAAGRQFGLGGLSASAPMAATPGASKPLPRALDLSQQRAYLGAAERQAMLFDRIAPPAPAIEEGRDKFEATETNPVKQVANEPVSTFSLDVDTASYAFVRRALNSGHLPPKDAVRVEEMINYFPYDYAKPDRAEEPFKPTVTLMPSPWNAHNKLVHVAIKGYDLQTTERPKANLVFLIDVSGSMAGPDRLPLVKNAFRLLVDQLKADDTVGIVTYASGSGILLEPTKVADRAKILAAIDKLSAGGSTAGADGIADAYRLAEAGFDKAAVNRIILATDGDFNVGITDRDQLKSTIERKRESGIFLSILGVGAGNHNDALMQALAQNGNGTAAYVDTLNEARKVLVDEASSTLFTIAKDVKVQIEWNPARIAEYRLIGYETRGLKREDFNNDGVDAGDIGSGHTVTAIYEVTPVGAPRLADDLRYSKAEPEKAGDAGRPTVAAVAATGMSDEIGFLKIRYKKPDEDVSQLISLPLTDALAKANLHDVAAEQRFSVAVAAFGQLLRGESYVRGFGYDDILSLAQGARGDDPYGYRSEFLNLVRLAKSAR